MIVALLAAFQLAAASRTRRCADREGREPQACRCRSSRRRPDRSCAPDQLRPVVPITVSHLTGDRWLLIVGGASIEVEEGVRFARVGDATFQLARAPEVRKGVLYVPLQLVVELVPRIAGNLAWDVDRFELRAFSSTTRYEDRAVSQAGRASAPRPRDGVDDAASGERTTRGVAVAASATPRGPLRSRRLVVVDAGHGGPDRGCAARSAAARASPRRTSRSPSPSASARRSAQRGIDVKYHADDRHADRARPTAAASPTKRTGDLFVSHPRQRGESRAGRIPARRAASRRISSPRRRPKTPGAWSRWKTKSVKFETRADGARRRSAQLHPQRHGAERAPARVERARGADPATPRPHASRPEPRREAGRIPRAGHRVHAGGARRDRLRHERRRGGVHDRSDAACEELVGRRSPTATIEYLKRYERRVASGTGVGATGAWPGSERRPLRARRSRRPVSTFRIPIVLAAGTAAYGHELDDVIDLDALGGHRHEGGESRAARRARRRRASRSSTAG